MAKRKGLQGTTPSESPVVHHTCSECGYVGQVGNEVVPYSFAKGDYRWLCWCGLRDCLSKAWNKFKAA